MHPPPRSALGLMLLLLALVAVGSSPALAAAAAAPDPAKGPPVVQRTVQQVTPIFANGSLQGTWHDTSVASSTVEASSTDRPQSLSVRVDERGYLRFTSTTAHPADSVLDLWAAGSGLTSISLTISDSVTNLGSKDVRFTSPEAMRGAVTILGNTDDGWIHLRIDLAVLRSPAANATTASTASCSGPASTTFDTITVADVGFMGFRLMLDDVRLLSKDTVGAADSSALFLPRSSVVPVFADDLDDLKAGSNRYLMKLRPNATADGVARICQELSAEGQRFSGACHTPLSTLSKAGKLTWGLVSFSVDSPADLLAMRKALGKVIEYAEADLTAFTTVRALRQAIKSGAGPLNISVDSLVTTDTDPAATAQRPDWATPNNAASKGSRPSWARSATQGAPQASASDCSTEAIKPVDLGAGKDGVATAPGMLDGQVGGSEQSASIQAVSCWGLDRLNQVDLPLDGVYSSGDYDGRGVHVYVLDTGVRTSHLDFRGRVGAGASAVGSSVLDDNGHGTHVAGIALGGIHGVAPSAILHPVKVMGADGSGAYSAIISGLQWVKDHKARSNIGSAVVVMSLAGPRSASLNDAIDAASRAGITMVVAAGNNQGADSCTMSPSSASTAIAVGASTDRDALASFSNIGRCLSLFAPGNYITSASFKGDSSEVIMSGTSMAAPHVAGAAALYLQYRPQASPAEVKAALQRAAVGKFIHNSSPQLLLNAISSRLRAAAPQAAPAPAPAPAPPAPAPATKPAAPAPAPQPSFGSSLRLPSSFCSTCTWCQFC